MIATRILFFLLFATLHADICFFIPPKGWEVVDPEKISPCVHICFIEKRASGVAPSVNLATEPVTISIDAYVNEVKKIHAADPNAKWRDLGKFQTLLGSGRLTEIELPTELGKARLVQLIVVKDQLAYILTACALKEEFSKYYKTFDQVLRSLQSTPDLVESYPRAEQPLLIQAIKNFTAEGNWNDFEKKIINDFTEMGPYWQILMLNEARGKIPPDTKLLTKRST